MGKLRGFMEYDRIKEDAIDPKKRIENYKEFTIAPKTEKLQEQGGDAWTVAFLSATVVAL